MTSPRTLRFVASIVLSALLAGLATGTVLGHAELATVTPADKSSVTAPPSEIVITYTEPLKPANSSIKLVDTNGKVVVEGGTVDAGDPKTMRLALPADLGIGTYTARWTSASALDGDLDHGTTTFTYAVGPIPGTPGPTGGTSPSGPPSPSTTSSSVASLPVGSPSAPATTPTASTSDAVIPIVVALIVLAALGLWLLRGRTRGSR
jgi:copper resistance protein C